MKRPTRSLVFALLASLALSVSMFNPALADGGPTGKHGMDLRSDVIAQHGLAVEPEDGVPPGADLKDHSERGLRNVQVNDPALDHIQTLPGERPFEFATESETSIATFGDNIVVGYNSSAAVSVEQSPGGLRFVNFHLSGYSVSHDGGRTWQSGFVPPASGSDFTLGDPSVGVDRAGNFYYASLGRNAAGTNAIIVNKSTDGGTTFGPAVVAAVDSGRDKDWLAVGPDPANLSHDNIYFAWTSFQPALSRAVRSELRFAKSSDGGATWTFKVLFAPTDGGPNGMSAFIQSANPVVDASTGRLYIPFLHFSNFDADFIKVLVSDDTGNTFRFLEFNVPGAPDQFGFPNVTPGTFSDCGTGGGFRLVLHQGANLAGGRGGLPRYRQATRLLTQPSAGAAQGKLFLALNSSTSPIFGDPSSRSEIRLLFSPDGGRTFATPVTVAAATAADPQHVLPSLSVDEEGKHVSVTYYVQQANEQVRVDIASGAVEANRVRFDPDQVQRVSSVAFDLTPSNNPIPTATNPFLTTNFDRLIAPCYDLGEYLGTTEVHRQILAAWGDNRNPWTSPAGSPAAGTHAQPDVFFNEVRAQ